MFVDINFSIRSIPYTAQTPENMPKLETPHFKMAAGPGQARAGSGQACVAATQARVAHTRPVAVSQQHNGAVEMPQQHIGAVEMQQQLSWLFSTV